LIVVQAALIAVDTSLLGRSLDVHDTEDPTMTDVSDLFARDFSDIEQRAVDRIRADLPATPIHNSVSETNPLNLIPDFGSIDRHTGPDQGAFAS
jgi:hypothetical protein